MKDTSKGFMIGLGVGAALGFASYLVIWLGV